MAEKDKQDREFAVGDKLKVKLHDGRIVDATVRAIVDDGELQSSAISANKDCCQKRP